MPERDWSTFACPNPNCSRYRQTGGTNIRPHGWSSKQRGIGIGIAALVVGLQEQEVGDRFDSHQAGLVTVEVLIQAGDDALGSHARSEALLFALAIGEDLLAQGFGQSVLGAVGRGDEGVEASLDEEAAEVADAAGAGLVEGGMGGQDEAAQEAFAGHAVQEGSHVGLVGVAVVVLLLASQPVVEGGVRDTGLLGELASGRVRWLAVAEVVEGLRGVGATPAEGVWPGVGVGVKLTGSHGLCLCGSCGKDTVGRQARLVQGARAQKQGTGDHY